MQQQSPDTFSIGQQLNSFASNALEPRVESFLPTPICTPSTDAQSNASKSTVTPDAEVIREDHSASIIRPGIKFASSKRVAILRPRQIWEGTVIEVTGDRFFAKLADRTNPTNPDEQAVFELSEVSPEDEKLIKPGSSFYWTVGTEKSPAGQIRNVAVVNFRRLPRWTASSVRKAEERASRLMEMFGPK